MDLEWLVWDLYNRFGLTTRASKDWSCFVFKVYLLFALIPTAFECYSKMYAAYHFVERDIYQFKICLEAARDEVFSDYDKAELSPKIEEYIELINGLDKYRPKEEITSVHWFHLLKLIVCLKRENAEGLKTDKDSIIKRASKRYCNLPEELFEHTYELLVKCGFMER